MEMVQSLDDEAEPMLELESPRRCLTTRHKSSFVSPMSWIWANQTVLRAQPRYETVIDGARFGINDKDCNPAAPALRRDR